MNLFDAIFTDKSFAATAVLYEQRQITYGDLREQTMRIAAVLSSLNLAAGDRVAILLHDSPEFITSFTAICSSGAIAVPINMALWLDEQSLNRRELTGDFQVACVTNQGNCKNPARRAACPSRNRSKSALTRRSNSWR